ncbi:hypothetical protein [Geobacter sp.]|uniref:hypothetical protein n=1 Tax=Geobacter sp. TaxID=46610 RepID=UPI00262092D4|nr:hypothetical protein [Geobacter sp.]
MAVKGDRARLEPVARQMYVDGRSLTAIEETLEVSRQTLAEWRDRGGWDKAKAARDNYEAQLVQVRDEIMERITEAPLQASAHLDSLSKIEAILDRRTKAAREAADAIARQKGEMFLSVVKDLIEFGRTHDQDLVGAIEGNFDELISWGREKYAGT